MALLAVIFGLAAAIAWGVGDFFGAKTSKRWGGISTAVLLLTISTLLFSVVFVVFFREHFVFDATAWGYAAASGVIFTIANLAFYRGLELGPVSIVSPLGSLYPLVTTLVLVLFFGSNLSARQGVGIAIVMAGMLAASGLFERVTTGRKLSKGPLLGVIAGVLWGVAWALQAKAVENVGWQLASQLNNVSGWFVYLLILPLLIRNEPTGMIKRISKGLRSPLAIVAATLTMSGFLIMSLGVGIIGEYAPTAFVVSSCYAVLTSILALRHLDEALDPIPLAGALVAIGGIVVLSLG